MKMSNKITIYKKLAKARVDFGNVEIKKSGYNKYGDFSYMELSDFLPTANRIMFENGLCAMINVSETLATMDIIDVDSEDGNSIQITIPIPAGFTNQKMNVLQVQGSICTYMSRYLWLSALQISENCPVDCMPQGSESNSKKGSYNNKANNTNNNNKASKPATQSLVPNEANEANEAKFLENGDARATKHNLSFPRNKKANDLISQAQQGVVFGKGKSLGFAGDRKSELNDYIYKIFGKKLEELNNGEWLYLVVRLEEKIAQDRANKTQNNVGGWSVS